MRSNPLSSYISEDEEYSLIEEPDTGLGFTDLVYVVWNKSAIANWNSARESLTVNDIKVLHHLFLCRKYKSISELKIELGFTSKFLSDSLVHLVDAGLILKSRNEKYKCRKKSDIFFVNHIVSIEAKLHDWRRALYQASNNLIFSSESYTLFPESAITTTMKNEYLKSDVGIISYRDSAEIIQKSKRNTIPISLTSWMFNEYVGRMQHASK
jgi:predicted transcriptional regulator